MKVMHIRVVLSFSLAIWKTRRFYRVAVGAPALNQASRRVLLELTPLLCNWLGGGRRNKEAERRSFLAAVSILPTPATFVYTDGSSFGNPGPSGAGFAVSNDNEHFRHLGSRSLGRSTNNAAELEAIQDATAFLLGKTGPGPIYIFSDNRLAIQVAMGRACPEWAAAVSQTIRDNITALVASRAVHLMWVPGHADVPGNEVADKLAKLGSSGISGTWTNPAELPHFSAPQPESAGPDAGRGSATSCEQCAQVLQGMRLAAKPRRRPPRRAQGGRSRHSRSKYNLRSKSIATNRAAEAHASSRPPILQDAFRAGARQEGQEAPLFGSARFARSVCDWGYEGYTEAEGGTSTSEADSSCSPPFSTLQASPSSLLSRPAESSGSGPAVRFGVSVSPARPEVVAGGSSGSPDLSSMQLSPLALPVSSASTSAAAALSDPPLASSRSSEGTRRTDAVGVSSAAVGPRSSEAMAAAAVTASGVPEMRSDSGCSLCSGSSVGPEWPAADATLPSALLAQGSKLEPSSSLPSSGEEVSASAVSAFPLPAPSSASDGWRCAAAAPSPSGLSPSVGSGFRGRVETTCPQPFSAGASSRQAAGAVPRSKCGQRFPLSLRLGGEDVPVAAVQAPPPGRVGGVKGPRRTSGETPLRTIAGLVLGTEGPPGASAAATTSAREASGIPLAPFPPVSLDAPPVSLAGAVPSLPPLSHPSIRKMSDESDEAPGAEGPSESSFAAAVTHALSLPTAVGGQHGAPADDASSPLPSLPPSRREGFDDRKSVREPSAPLGAPRLMAQRRVDRYFELAPHPSMGAPPPTGRWRAPTSDSPCQAVRQSARPAIRRPTLRHPKRKRRDARARLAKRPKTSQPSDSASKPKRKRKLSPASGPNYYPIFSRRKRPRTSKARTNNANVQKQAAPQGTECLGANFPT